MPQLRKEKLSKRDAQAIAAEDATATKTREVDLEGIDDLLDEIDSVLEKNAEEFVRNYVQKGGQ